MTENGTFGPTTQESGNEIKANYTQTITYGDYFAYFGGFLNSVLAHAPLDAIELRLGFNQAPDSFFHALG